MSQIILYSFDEWDWKKINIQEKFTKDEMDIIVCKLNGREIRDYTRNKDYFKGMENSSILNKSKYKDGSQVEIKKNGKYKKVGDKNMEIKPTKKSIDEMKYINSNLSEVWQGRSTYTNNQGEGGRMYSMMGSLRKEYRETINKLYNNDEVDAKSCQINFLYKILTGKYYDNENKYKSNNDPYTDVLEDIRMDYENKRLRKYIKHITLSGPMSSSIKEWEGVIREQTYKQGMTDILKENNVTQMQVKEAIMKVNHKIKEAFGKGLSGILQNLESKMIKKILKKCMKKRIPCNPIHDGIQPKIPPYYNYGRIGGVILKL